MKSLTHLASLLRGDKRIVEKQPGVFHAKLSKAADPLKIKLKDDFLVVTKASGKKTKVSYNEAPSYINGLLSIKTGGGQWSLEETVAATAKLAKCYGDRVRKKDRKAIVEKERNWFRIDVETKKNNRKAMNPKWGDGGGGGEGTLVAVSSMGAVIIDWDDSTCARNIYIYDQVVKNFKKGKEFGTMPDHTYIREWERKKENGELGPRRRRRRKGVKGKPRTGGGGRGRGLGVGGKDLQGADLAAATDAVKGMRQGAAIQLLIEKHDASNDTIASILEIELKPVATKRRALLRAAKAKEE